MWPKYVSLLAFLWCLDFSYPQLSIPQDGYHESFRTARIRETKLVEHTQQFEFHCILLDLFRAISDRLLLGGKDWDTLVGVRAWVDGVPFCFVHLLSSFPLLFALPFFFP